MAYKNIWNLFKDMKENGSDDIWAADGPCEPGGPFFGWVCQKTERCWKINLGDAQRSLKLGDPESIRLVKDYFWGGDKEKRNRGIAQVIKDLPYFKKKNKWVRVENVQPYIKDEQYSEESALVNRLYSLNGKKYPLLAITIYSNSILGKLTPVKHIGIRVEVSYKSKRNAWWDSYAGNADVYIPTELINDLKEMIVEAEKEINGSPTNNK